MMGIFSLGSVIPIIINNDDNKVKRIVSVICKIFSICLDIVVLK